MNGLRFCGLLATGVLVACSSTDSNSDPDPTPGTGLALQTVSTAFDFPVFLTSPTGDATRLFVVEKGGLIRIIKNGNLLPTPFLDISGQVAGGSEQGLLGLTFAPDYATSGRFYVSYVGPGDTEGGTSVISRYTVSANPDIAAAGAEDTVLTVAQPADNHKGGGIAFGPDGYLYIGFGDGGPGGDPDGTGQSRDDFLGSLLRIDVSGAGYTVPADNPFVGTAFKSELWNYGLRNPWRWSFDRQTGDLYIADVGQSEREEVDVQPSSSTGGENYGWSVTEGLVCYNPTSGCDKTGITLPVVNYSHSFGCSISGGYAYRGSVLPDAVKGAYFYSDYCGGWVRSFKWSGGTVTEKTGWAALAPGGRVTSFGEDAAGELYILTELGGVYKIVPAAS